MNLLRHFLEESAGGATASRTRGHLGGEAADAEGLQNLLSYADFFGAIAAGSGRERDADGVANAFLQQHAQSGARSYDAFGAHAGFSEPQCSG